MADVKWIKIVTDIFDDEKILLIESLPSSDVIIVIWFKLLCFAGKNNNHGVFMLSNKIAYTDEMLATIFRRDLNTIRLALKTFEDFGMIEMVNNTITIPNWDKHQTLDAYEKKKERDRIYQAERREKQKLIAGKSSDKSSKKSSDVVVSEEEKEKEEDKDIDITSSSDFNILKYAEQRNFILSAVQIEQLQEDVNIYSLEEVKKALEIADNNGKRNYTYFKAVLNNRRNGGDNSGFNKQRHKGQGQRHESYGQGLEEGIGFNIDDL